MQTSHATEMLHVTLALLSFSTALLPTSESEEQIMKIGEGESITFHTSAHKKIQFDDQVLWSYGHLNPNTLIAQIYQRDINTEFSERFRDRLQLDKERGCLTIRNATAIDSGIYRVEVTGGGFSNVTCFQCAVYAPVPKPVLSTIPGNQSIIRPSAVLVECSVENGREVTLSWHRGNDLLSKTSSPDINITLRLPLVVRQQDITVYTCVAANPVNNQTVPLSTEELLLLHKGSKQCSHCCDAIVVRLVLSALVTVVMAALLVEHFRGNKSHGIVCLT
ncbi:HEPACAM family member 2-like [Sardina pilchardus]|uniref:HEPACAM family member 2-like n=1 Tax=Sardina pilchardus TaxID=27697 RepID=UPI002E0D6CD5